MRAYAAEKSITDGLDPVFLAWAAGFIDGEGCIRCHVTRNDNTGPRAAPTKTRLRLQVAQKPREALDLLCENFGVGAVCRRSNGVHLWNVNTRQAEQVIRAVFPYLVVKRKDALRALDRAGYYPPPMIALDTSPPCIARGLD